MPAALAALLPILIQAIGGAINWEAVAKAGSDLIDKLRAEGRTEPTMEDLKPLLDLFDTTDAELTAAIAQAKAEGR